MMIDAVTCRRLLMAPLLALAATGCGSPDSSVQFTSYRDPYFPEQYQLELTECAYVADADRDVDIVGRATYTPQDTAAGTVEQLLHIHLFWHPVPGKTPDDASGSDATLQYVITTDRGAAVYSGTGFIYTRKNDWNGQLDVQIEGGRLRLDNTLGDPPSLLGDSRIVGRLQARNDGALALELMQQVKRTAALETWPVARK